MKTNICTFLKHIQSFIFIGLCLFGAPSLAAEANKPLDGVPIEAVETYPNLRDHMLGIGIGLYPFNAYYLGILINGSYLFNLSPTTSWEVLNVNYAYSVQNSLTTELADKGNVNPTTINRLELIVSTAAHFTILNGKFIIMKNNIRYFRGILITGMGLAKTNTAASIAPVLGARFETYSSDSFSWSFDLRNTISTRGFTNYVTFTLGLNFNI